MQHLQPLLDTADVARIFRVSPNTVRRWLQAGKLKAVRVGRELRFDPEAIERLVNGSENQRIERGARVGVIARSLTETANFE